MRDVVTEMSDGLARIRIWQGFEGVDRADEWARPRRTRYSTEEWIQRRMARNAESKDEVELAPAAGAVAAKLKEEFRIWSDEKAAVRKLEQLAELEVTRQEKDQRRRERQRRTLQRERLPKDLVLVSRAEVPTERTCMNWGCVIDRRTGEIEHASGCAHESMRPPTSWTAERVAAWVRGDP